MTWMNDLLADGRSHPEDEHRWHIDRKVSIGVIVALAINFGAGVWYLRGMDSRLGMVETWTHENAGTEHRLTAVETKLDILIEQKRAAR